MNKLISCLSKSKQNTKNLKHFKGQNFYKILPILLNSDVLFEDDCFPLDVPDTYKEDLIWMRPNDIVPGPIMMDNSCSSYQIKQGVFTPDWFPVLMVSIRQSKLYEKILLNRPQLEEVYEIMHPNMGLYHFKFFIDGFWSSVVIDDRLPTKDGNLLSTQSSNPDEFFEPLLEKALAKIYGGYANLKAHNLIDTASLLIAGGVNKIKLDFDDSKDLKDLISHFLSYNDILMAKVEGINGMHVDYRNGLLANTFYALNRISVAPKKISTTPINKLASSISLDSRVTELINLRDPLQVDHWKGSFHRKSLEWSHVSKHAMERFDLNVDSDNEFWMPLEDFGKLFTELYVGFTEFVYSWHSKVIIDNWDKCVSLLEHKQYVVDVKNTGGTEIRMILSKIRKENSAFDEDYLNAKFGIKIFQIEHNRKYRVHTMNSVKRITIINKSYTNINFTLSAKLFHGNYVIIPWIEHVKKMYIYCLRIYTNVLHEIKLLVHDEPSKMLLSNCMICRTTLITRVILKSATLIRSSPLPTYAIVECENVHLFTEPLYEYPFIWNESFIFYRHNPRKKPIIIKLKNVVDNSKTLDQVIGYYEFYTRGRVRNTVEEVFLYNMINKTRICTASKIIFQIIDYNSEQFSKA